MKPPRYLLREAVVKRLVLKLGAARVLELGFGRGDMLLTLAECGLHGVGYDPSADARAHTQQRLDAAGITCFVLSETYPDEDLFDAILFFEVIGYADDPIAWLAGHRKILKSSGQLIFSFTNDRHQGIAEKATGQMRCFNKSEMHSILNEAGYRVDQMINYGFPLANLLRWVRALIYRGQPEISNQHSLVRKQVDRSGFVEPSGWVKLGTAVFNTGFMRPFVWIQSWFSTTSAGTGFVVLASPKGE